MLEVGRIVEKKAHTKDERNITRNMISGNTSLIGRSVKSALCKLIIIPIDKPTKLPMMQLLNTSVNASKK